MSEFEVKAYTVKIEEHPNADVIELAKIGDYFSIVQKGTFKTGDTVLYIPEAAVVPDWLIIRLGLEGKLAGKKKNRVKAIRLRGILSQGLIVPTILDTTSQSPSHYITDNDDNKMQVSKDKDYTEFLSIYKYEPPIPIQMQGEVFNSFGKTLKYDIENIKKFPNIFQEGEEVCITEKLHGTFCLMGSHPDIDIPIVTSKGLSEKGLAFKFNDANKDNLYVRAFEATKDDKGLSIIDHVYEATDILTRDTPVYILGEIFGKRVQDLTYGEQNPNIRIFDIYVGNPGKGNYLSPQELSIIANEINVPTVPILYVGTYSRSVLSYYTDGKETISGKELHMREGIVIKPCTERYDNELGRVCLKSVSEVYILRKGKVSEYQ